MEHPFFVEVNAAKRVQTVQSVDDLERIHCCRVQSRGEVFGRHGFTELSEDFRKEW